MYGRIGKMTAVENQGDALLAIPVGGHGLGASE